MFCEKGVLRNFAKFTGKHLCQSLFFNKVAGPRPTTLVKKRLWHRRFPVNFAKFLGTRFLTEHLQWLLLYIVNYTDISHACPIDINIKVTDSIYDIFSPYLSITVNYSECSSFILSSCIFYFAMAAEFRFGLNFFALALSFVSSIFVMLFIRFLSQLNSNGYKY